MAAAEALAAALAAAVDAMAASPLAFAVESPVPPGPR